MSVAIEKPNSIPSEYICPLTQVVMLDPVASECSSKDGKCGHIFERQAIELWGQANSAFPCPLDRKTIIRLVPQFELQQRIYSFINKNPELFDGNSVREMQLDQLEVCKKNCYGILEGIRNEEFNERAALIIEQCSQERTSKALKVMKKISSMYLDFMAQCPGDLKGIQKKVIKRAYTGGKNEHRFCSLSMNTHPLMDIGSRVEYYELTGEKIDLLIREPIQILVQSLEPLIAEVAGETERVATAVLALLKERTKKLAHFRVGVLIKITDVAGLVQYERASDRPVAISVLPSEFQGPIPDECIESSVHTSSDPSDQILNEALDAVVNLEDCLDETLAEIFNR